MPEYKPNSHRSKEEKNLPAEKKVNKIVTGKVTTKKNPTRKLKDTFISDEIHNVKDYIFLDVLIPAAKKAISDIVTNGIDMILYGETGHTKKKSGASTVSYRNYYDRRDDRDRYSSSSRSRVGYDFDDIVLESRAEAEEVIQRMDELIDTYGIVSVADMYDLVGLTCNYTDNKYGWTNIRNAEAVRLRDGGWVIKMPKALPIE